MKNLQLSNHEYNKISTNGKYIVDGDFIFMPNSYTVISEFLATVRHGGRITVKDFNGNPVCDLDAPMATGYIAELNFYEIDENVNYVTDKKYVVVPGDLNGDGAVDARDIALLDRLCGGDQLLLCDKFSKSGLYKAAAGGRINSAAAENLKQTVLKMPSRHHRVTVNGNSLAAYAVSRPKICSLLWTEKIDVLVRTVKKYTGLELPIVCGCTDCPKIVINDPCAKEIVADYEIKADGNNLVINGRDDESIYSALNFIIAEISAGDCDLSDCTGSKKSDDYTLVYGDEFDGEELDRRIWNDYTANPEERVSIFQIYDEENDRNITVKEADALPEMLVKQRDAEGIQLKNSCMEVPVICHDTENYKTAVYETHQPVTEDRLLYRYGLLEIKAKLPKFPATTALWSTGTGLEIDLVEGSQKPDSTGYSFLANVHIPDPKSNGRRVAHSYERYNKKRCFATDENLTESFHIYSVRWTPDYMEFAVDGNVFWKLELNEFDTDEMMHNSKQFIFTGASYGSTYFSGEYMAAYGYNAQTINKWIAEGNKLPRETTLYVDYVHLYQDKTEKGSYLEMAED